MKDQGDKTQIPDDKNNPDSGIVSGNEHIDQGLPNFLTNPSNKGDTHEIMVNKATDSNETGIKYFHQL